MLPGKLKVLFLCTGNSCRSQMAEGWARALKGDSIEPYSADLVSAPRRIVLGKKSGLVSIKLKVEELGLDVPEERFPGLLAEVKKQATAAGRLMSDDEFRQLVKRPAGAA